MNVGQQLWQQAIQCIPGGNGLLSKRPDRYAPDIWPIYFDKSKGVSLWDLEGHEYIDVAQMGIGSVILGYCDEDVDTAVKNAIDKGINATLNAPEEVSLAQRLLKLNSFAGGVKFARTGGEAMSIAVRIARAYTGRDAVAFSGYHGWCDWYLATNLISDDNLTSHLLPGLSPKGVPQGLTGTAFPFEYNNVKAFQTLMAQHKEIGIIVIEGARYTPPTQDFLQAIQESARKYKKVVIIDEITSGWQITDGGVYKTLGFNPDIVVYGKAMGNGYAISAIVGKKEVMDVAQDTFISSTFWTERIGFVAALATIQKLCQHKVWEHLIQMGSKISKGWEKAASQHGLKLHASEFKPLATMIFEYDKMNAAIATLFIQEMLKRGYIASTSFYVSYAHTEQIVDKYLGVIDDVFSVIAQAVKAGSVEKLLQTRIKDDGFKRLTKLN